MSLISAGDQEAIRTHFAGNMANEVEIVLFTERVSPLIIPGREQCETCEQTEQLIREVVELSDKLKLTVHELSNSADEAKKYGIDRVPAFVVKGLNRGLMRFFGIPAGYEFSAFISDLVDASRGQTNLSPETLEFLSTLTENVNLKVFTTPT